MVYNWDPHREVCYRLYVEEKRSLDEIVEYMREHYDFTPRYVFCFILLIIIFMLPLHPLVSGSPYRPGSTAAAAQ